MQGTIRSYHEETLGEIEKKIIKISEATADALNCKANVEISRLYPETSNPAKETDHIIRLCKKWFGPEHFSQ
jgi:metal-dependent amidase/aminoacylase/carboxypeptidase family protein